MGLDIIRGYNVAETSFLGIFWFGTYLAQNGTKICQKFDPLNFNSNLQHFPDKMVKNGPQHPEAHWIELSENQNFKKIGPVIPKIWAEKGRKRPFF